MYITIVTTPSPWKYIRVLRKETLHMNDALFPKAEFIIWYTSVPELLGGSTES